MGAHECTWVHMSVHECTCVYMCIHGFTRVYMGVYLGVCSLGNVILIILNITLLALEYIGFSHSTK